MKPENKHKSKIKIVSSRKSKENKGVVFIAMSGGVDSSVAALLLKQRGFGVIGVFMKNWTEKVPGLIYCPWEEDQRSARMAAAKIGIPFYTWNFEVEYKKIVFHNFIEGYQKGEIGKLKLKPFHAASGVGGSLISVDADQFQVEPQTFACQGVVAVHHGVVAFKGDQLKGIGLAIGHGHLKGHPLHRLFGQMLFGHRYHQVFDPFAVGIFRLDHHVFAAPHFHAVYGLVKAGDHLPRAQHKGKRFAPPGGVKNLVVVKSAMVVNLNAVARSGYGHDYLVLRKGGGLAALAEPAATEVSPHPRAAKGKTHAAGFCRFGQDGSRKN